MENTEELVVLKVLNVVNDVPTTILKTGEIVLAKYVTPWSENYVGYKEAATLVSYEKYMNMNDDTRGFERDADENLLNELKKTLNRFLTWSDIAEAYERNMNLLLEKSVGKFCNSQNYIQFSIHPQAIRPAATRLRYACWSKVSGPMPCTTMYRCDKTTIAIPT